MPGAGDPRSWDRYAYVKNNPILYNDPSGHDVGCAGNSAEFCRKNKSPRIEVPPPPPPLLPNSPKLGEVNTPTPQTVLKPGPTNRPTPTATEKPPSLGEQLYNLRQMAREVDPASLNWTAGTTLQYKNIMQQALIVTKGLPPPFNGLYPLVAAVDKIPQATITAGAILYDSWTGTGEYQDVLKPTTMNIIRVITITWIVIILVPK